MVKSVREIWRDYVTDGVPSSGGHKPKKSEIRVWGETYEELSGALVFQGADTTGATDISAILAAASSTNEYLVLTPGLYLVNSAAAIPAGMTVVAHNGAKLTRGASGSLAWDGGLIGLGGERQQIFDASWVSGPYTRIGDTPYPLALTGSPKIEAANPFWFGINEGASVTGAANILQNDKALHLALYWGKKMRIPKSTIRSPRLDLRQDDMLVFGHGADSLLMICDAADLPASHRAGSVIGITGDPPTTASGNAARYTKRSKVEKIGLDGRDQTNINGLGVSFADGCGGSEVMLFNIGRKALTAQYHCHGTRFEGCIVEEACQEAGSTHAALSTEGQVAGIDFTVLGGVASTDDLLGADMTDNIYRDIRVKVTGHGVITTSNAHNTKYVDIYAGDAQSTGTHIIETRVCKNTQVSRYRGGNTSRRFIFSDAQSEDLQVDRAVFGDNLSANADGYSLHDKGVRAVYKGVEFDHSNTATTGSRAVFLEGTDTEIDRMRVRSNDATTSIASTSAAHRTSIHDSKFNTPGARTMILGGDDVSVDNNYCDASSNATGIQLQGNRPRATRNRILGNATQRILVDGTTAAPNAYVVGNQLDGGSAQINFSGNTLFSSVCENNPGNMNTGDNGLMGPNARWQDATGDLRVMTTGAVRTSDTDGVVVGTQT